MKILGVTEGGSEIGFGHITRCIALYQALEAEGAQVTLLVNGDDSTRFLVQGLRADLFDWQTQKDDFFRHLSQFDAVIIDSYRAELDFYVRCADMCQGRMISIDDYNRIPYPRGVVVSPSLYGDQLSYSSNQPVTYLRGADYVIMRKSFWDLEASEIKQTARMVTVCFGGMNHAHFLDSLLQHLSSRPDLTIEGIDVQQKHLSVDEMVTQMRSSDIWISGGGQTLNELARIGIPAISVCFADNQLRHAQAWHERGVVEFIGWHHEAEIARRINETLDRYLDYNERTQRSVEGRAVIDGQGARRIARFVKQKFS